MVARRRPYLWVCCLGCFLLLLAGCSKAPAPPSPAPPTELAAACQIVTNTQAPLSTRRPAVIQLAATLEGAQFLLNWAEGGALSPDLRGVVTLELAHLPWPDLRTQAWEILPPYHDRDQRVLPRFHAFFQIRGDPTRGQALFRHPDLNCIGCHRLNGEGVLLGSDLSDIGLRMEPAELLESILDPSGIITAGYETWLVVDAEENEHVGVLSRETDEAVFLRDAKNNEIMIHRSKITQRRQVPVSIMPAGLQQSMTTQDLADLLAFLQNCRQSPPAQTPPASGGRLSQ